MSVTPFVSLWVDVYFSRCAWGVSGEYLINDNTISQKHSERLNAYFRRHSYANTGVLRT